MPSTDQTLRTYRELAEKYGRQGQTQMRDRFLVLAADAALAGGQKEEAELLRCRLLLHNSRHLLQPYSSFAEAMKSADVQNYVNALRRSHPLEKAENLLEGLRQKEDHFPAEETPRPLRPPASTKNEPAGQTEGSEERDALKVFRVRDADAPATHSHSLAPNASASSPRPVVPPPSIPAGAPEVIPLRRELFADNLTRADLLPEREDHEPGSSAWVPVGLFVLVLVLGIGFAAYTFVRPFLPPTWFR
jgi:hypothetical protein